MIKLTKVKEIAWAWLLKLSKKKIIFPNKKSRVIKIIMRRETLQYLMIKDWTSRDGNDLQKELTRSLKRNSGGKFKEVLKDKTHDPSKSRWKCCQNQAWAKVRDLTINQTLAWKRNDCNCTGTGSYSARKDTCIVRAQMH